MQILEEKKLSLFKKYYLEASVLFLAAILGMTVNFVINLNNKFVNYIVEDKINTAKQLDKSSNALENNTSVLQEIKTVLKDNK